MRHVPEIKLIRTDTTLDLSQKAEKVCLGFGAGSHLKAAEAQFRSGRGAPRYLARPILRACPISGFGNQKQTGPQKNKNKKEKKQENLVFFRIEKRGLNLKRSMQQGISTLYNTRFGI